MPNSAQKLAIENTTIHDYLNAFNGNTCIRIHYVDCLLFAYITLTPCMHTPSVSNKDPTNYSDDKKVLQFHAHFRFKFIVCHQKMFFLIAYCPRN